jgi:hypothetical protein
MATFSKGEVKRLDPKGQQDTTNRNLLHSRPMRAQGVHFYYESLAMQTHFPQGTGSLSPNPLQVLFLARQSRFKPQWAEAY